MYVAFAFVWGVGVVLVVVGSIWSVYVVLNSVVFRADAVAGPEGGVDLRFLCTPAVGWVCAVTGRDCGGCECALYSGVMLAFTLIAVAQGA